MKKPLTVFIVIAILLFLCSCGSKEPENKKQQEESQPRTTITENTTDETSSESVDEKLLEAVMPFQGEWKNIRLNNKVIIRNETVNYIHYGITHENAVSDVFTFYFAFDENENLVVNNRYGQTREIIYIDTDGTLVVKDSYTGKEEDNGRYEKVSDNTIVPDVSEDPHIGMTEEQVLHSTWGSPKKRNKTTTASVISEQWVYDDGYIYLTNGIVTAIQE